MSTKHFVQQAYRDRKYDRTDMFGKKRPSPSQDYLDRVADLKLAGGFKLKKSNICPTCQTYKSANGTCSCC